MTPPLTFYPESRILATEEMEVFSYARFRRSPGSQQGGLDAAGALHPEQGSLGPADRPGLLGRRSVEGVGLALRRGDCLPARQGRLAGRRPGREAPVR